MTVTPAEQNISRQLACQYDSGKDSMTCSDASGHSNCSEIQPNMIKLDSLVNLPTTRTRLSSCIDFIAAEFDPLRPSLSHDSLLESTGQDRNVNTSSAHHHRRLTPPMTAATSGSALGKNFEWNFDATPLVPTGTKKHPHRHMSHPASPKVADSSPKQSLATSTKSITDLPSSSHHCQPSSIPSPSIVRPRPKPSKVVLKTISAPSSRPHSPKMEAAESAPKWDHGSSPTGSMKCIKDLTFGSYFADYADSDTTSANSSQLDLMGEEVDDATLYHLSLDIFNCGFLSQQ